MSLNSVAAQMGVEPKSVEELLGGTVSRGVAGMLGLSQESVQDFVDGGVSIGLERKIGWSAETQKELREAIGQQGAVGLIIGLCIKALAEKKRA